MGSRHLPVLGGRGAGGDDSVRAARDPARRHARHRGTVARPCPDGGAAACGGGADRAGAGSRRRRRAADPLLPARDHRLRQDRGVHGRRAARGGGRPRGDLPGAGDCPDPPGGRPVQRRIRRPGCGDSLRPHPVAAAATVGPHPRRCGARGDRSAQRGIRSAPRPRPDGDRRGARDLLQGGRNPPLPRPPGGDAPLFGRGRDPGDGQCHAVAGGAAPHAARRAAPPRPDPPPGRCAHAVDRGGGDEGPARSAVGTAARRDSRRRGGRPPVDPVPEPAWVLLLLSLPELRFRDALRALLGESYLSQGEPG